MLTPIEALRVFELLQKCLMYGAAELSRTQVAGFARLPSEIRFTLGVTLDWEGITASAA